MATRTELLAQLNDTVSRLTRLVRSLPDPFIEVYEGWNAKDVLAHVAFWHQSFARNAGDLARGVKPRPLRGTFRDLTARCFAEARTKSVEYLLTELETAHAVIRGCILQESLGMIPYKVGSRDYSPDEHLSIVHEHITQHITDIEKALTRSQKSPHP
jgi:hypothetical protein